MSLFALLKYFDWRRVLTADFSLSFSDAAIFVRLLGAEWEFLCEFVRGFNFDSTCFSFLMVKFFLL